MQSSLAGLSTGPQLAGWAYPDETIDNLALSRPLDNLRLSHGGVEAGCRSVRQVGWSRSAPVTEVL